MREILTDVLEGQGYEVTAVASGLAAVEEAARESYSLIVADIRMEGMNGLEALAQTKSYQPEIGSLVVSGYATPEETERAAELGVGAYLKKPFRMKRFVEAVRAQLSKVVREEEVQASENVADEAILWALESHLETVDTEGLHRPPGQLAELSRLARRLGLALNLDKAPARQVAVAAQFQFLSHSDFPQLPDWLVEQESLVAILSRSMSVNNSRESQIARLAAESLSESPPSSEDYLPEVWQAYQELGEETSGEFEAADSSIDEKNLRRAGSLLILGRTMAQSGDTSNAKAAYDKALELAQSPEEKIRVRLESLAFELKQGKPEEDFAHRCQELVEMGSEQGPFAAAKLELEVGLLQRRHGQIEHARKNLSEAAERLNTLGQETLEGVSRVALHLAGAEQEHLDTAVSQLLHPSGLDELTSRAHWLIPAIAEAPVQVETLAQLVNVVPQVLSYAIEQSSVSLAGRKRILQALTSLSSPPQSLVTVLSQDPDPSVREEASRITSGPDQLARPLLKVRAFGGFEAHIGDELIGPKDWKTKKTMYLVACLSESWPKGMNDERLLDMFWPESVAKGKKNLYWAISMARGCLKADDDFNPILRENGRLFLNPEQPLWHDLLEFREALKDSREAEGKQLSVSLARLLRLYRGPYLEGCYFDWAVRMRDDLERSAGEAFLNLAQVLYQSQLFDESTEAAKASLKSAPLSQEAHLVLMQGEIKRGRPVAALEQFKVCKKILADEYGIEPGMDLVRCELEARMLQG